MFSIEIKTQEDAKVALEHLKGQLNDILKNGLPATFTAKGNVQTDGSTTITVELTKIINKVNSTK